MVGSFSWGMRGTQVSLQGMPQLINLPCKFMRKMIRTMMCFTYLPMTKSGEELPGFLDGASDSPVHHEISGF